jgi:excisionase family DNA binding protein
MPEQRQSTEQTSNPPKTERQVLNVAETAQYFNVSESLIWKEIREGNLKPLRMGDRVLFHRNYLDRLYEGR